jgi:hypothetical protein
MVDFQVLGITLPRNLQWTLFIIDYHPHVNRQGRP